MKICRDCKHFREGETEPWHYTCNVIPDLVIGGYVKRSAYEMRKPDQPCGPEGKLWLEIK